MIVATSDMPTPTPQEEKEAALSRIEALAARAGSVRDHMTRTMGDAEIELRVATLRHRVHGRDLGHDGDAPRSDSSVR